jgi:hypothetical protein
MYFGPTKYFPVTISPLHRFSRLRKTPVKYCVNALIFFLLHSFKIPAHEYDKRDKDGIDKVEWQQVFPFKRKDLVNPEPGECPFQPHDQVYNKKSLAKKPDEGRNKVHDTVKSCKVTNM